MQVLITVLCNGGASSYLLNHWNLFEQSSNQSPTDGNSLAVLVPQTSDDLDAEAPPNRTNNKQPSTTGSCAPHLAGGSLSVLACVRVCMYTLKQAYLAPES